MRALTIAVAALAGVAVALLQPRLAGGPVLSLAPVAVMVVVLLQGWRAAAVAAVLIALGTLFTGPAAAAQGAILGAASIACGEALRRGVRPTYVTLVQAVGALIAATPTLQPGRPATDPVLLAAVLLQACASVALATCVLMMLRRRAGSRCRTGWEHITFCAVAGMPALALLAVLATRTSTATGGILPLRIAVMVAICMLAAGVLSHVLERMVPGRRSRLVPAPLAGLLARTRRERQRALRAGRQLAALLRDARHQADASGRELAMVREALRQRTLRLEATDQMARDARERLRAVLEDSPDVHIFTDAAGVIESASGPAAELLGHAPASLAGRKVGQLVPAECMLDHPLEFGDQERGGPPSGAVECEVQTADGSRRKMTASIRAVNAASGRHYAIRLLRPQRAAGPAVTLEQVEDMKRSAARARDQFIATMSHELRTPLHGLIATLDMLRGEEMSQDLQHHLAIARTSARALLNIANDVLDLSRLGSNLFPLERRLFGLRAVLREVVEAVEARAQSLGLGVAVDILDELPPSVWGDPARLRQILGNLLTNALKFTARGGVTLRVRCRDGTCTFDVEDTGEGIPAEKREAIFEPFVQLGNRAAHRMGGTGLGLPISRRISEAAGGRLVLLRSSPQGSTFRLTLPLEASQEEPPDEQSQRVFTNPHGRILVVEDNPTNRYVAEALLASLECPATIVGSGREALDLLREQEFDLILMDCQMPDMDGYETTRRARRILKRRIPIIAMTANAMAEDRTECLAAGMDDFLPKPFGRQNLSEQLSKWLQPGNSRNPQLDDPARGAGLVPDLDDKVVDELWESLRWQREPLQRICSSLASSLHGFASALERQPVDQRALLRQAHTVLGSAGMVGARQVEYLAGRIQAALQAGQHADLKGAAEMLRRAMARFERELAQKLDGDAASRVGAGPRAS